jgi:hypothetical protein
MPKFPAIPWSDLFNPVLVKEARQLTRSKLLLAVIWIELFGLALFASGNLMWNLWDVEVSDAGQPFFLCLIQILAVAVACGALDSMLRTLEERDDGIGDLMYASTLSPGKILRGKFWAGWVVNLLILSLGLPFLSLSYLLRGVSLPMLMWGSFYLLVLAVLLVPLAQVIALLPVPNLLKKYGAGFCLVSGVVWLGFPVKDLLRELADRFGGLELLGWLALLAGLLLLLNSTARFLLTRSGVDRSWRPRLLMLVAALIWLLVLIGGTIFLTCRSPAPHSDMVMFFLVLVAGVALLHLLPALALMLALLCPAPMALAWYRPKRISAKWGFPLLEGSWNGLAFAGLLAGLAMVCTLAMQMVVFVFVDNSDYMGLNEIFSYLAAAPVFFGYLFCYAMTARYIGDWLRKHGRPAITALHLFCFMLVAAGIVTGVALVLTRNSNYHESKIILAGDVFAFFCDRQYDADRLTVHAMTVLAWSLPLLYWAYRLFIQLQPLRPLAGPQSKPPMWSWIFSFADISRIWQERPAKSRIWRLVPQRLLAWLGEINPVLVKEFRQMGRSRFPDFILWMEIGILLIVAVLGIANEWTVNQDHQEKFLKIVLLVPIMAVLSMCLEQLNRTAKERDSTAGDLLFVSPLTPRQIVLGKFTATLMPVLLMALPVGPMLLAFSRLPSGIHAVMSMAFLMSLGALLVAGAVLLAVLPVPARVKWYLFNPLLTIIGVCVARNHSGLLDDFCHDNLSMTFASGGCEILCMMLFMGCGVWLVNSMSIFFLKRADSDRSWLPRLTMLKVGAIWLAMLVGIALFIGSDAWASHPRGTVLDDMLWAGMMTLHFLLMLALMLALLAPRPMATAWHQPGQVPVKWKWSFPLQEGSWNGLVVVVVLAGMAMAGTLAKQLAFFIGGLWNEKPDDLFIYLAGAPVFLGYLFCYAMTACLIGDWLRRRGRGAITPLHLFGIMLTLAGVVTFVIAAFLRLPQSIHHERWCIMVGNVFAFACSRQCNDNYLVAHAAAMLLWSLLLLSWARRLSLRR